uniref:Uncharacterized protein n=1 Tax=Ananas comosus var. bracteatus TaxID=296719 RepID=A0A6V7Q3A8_ANACO|nr:unnamed protein product [Ananas comosus var. bracteatus]
MEEPSKEEPFDEDDALNREALDKDNSKPSNSPTSGDSNAAATFAAAENEEEEEEKEEEEDDDDDEENDSSSIEQLLEPFPKDQLVELLCDAAVNHRDVLEPVHRVADAGPPTARSSSTASAGTPSPRPSSPPSPSTARSSTARPPRQGHRQVQGLRLHPLQAPQLRPPRPQGAAEEDRQPHDLLLACFHGPCVTAGTPGLRGHPFRAAALLANLCAEDIAPHRPRRSRTCSDPVSEAFRVAPRLPDPSRRFSSISAPSRSSAPRPSSSLEGPLPSSTRSRATRGRSA